MEPTSGNSSGLAFGRFLLLPHRRELLAGSQPVRLGGRAFDLLTALVEARGAVLGKDALMARVWPGQIVEENALQSQISSLRAAFGADRDLIRTVAGRGYQFTGEIRAVSTDPDEHVGTTGTERAASVVKTNVLEPVSELIGREEILDEILGLAAAHRLVTLTGAGGIGKTRLALAVARQLLPDFADGVWLAELSALTDPGLVIAAVAAAVRLDLGGGELSAQRLAQALADRELLLVLDTCEHVVTAVAPLAETVLRAGQLVRILATSREPLQVEGEWVYPVPPLAVPPEDAEGEDELLRHGAVRLFIERARAANPRFAPAHRVVASIAAVSRQLDGIPLAIEMAAARASALPVDEIAARLKDRFHLLTAHRRTSLPRHQTLRATLDWSHELLAEPERAALRRLAVFAGPFSLEAASSVIANPPELSQWQAVEALSGLVAKSLVVADVSDDSMPFRLLDTTRAYAREKLDESGERATLSRRHAEYYRDLFERAEADVDARPAAEWLAEHGRAIANLRAALDWAFSPDGDASIGVALTAAAVPLWLHLSLLDRCRRRVEQALAALAAGAKCDARREMKLHAALGASLILTRPSPPKEVETSLTRALELAEALDDSEYRLRAFHGLWFFHTNRGQHRIALELAHRFRALAATQPNSNDRLVGERIIGTTLHFLGDQQSARRHIERVLENYAGSDHRSYLIRFQVELIEAARAYLARTLWLLGFPDQAVRTAERAVDDAWVVNHANPLCHALAMAACPIARLVGDLDAAEHYHETLLDHSRRYGLAVWHACGQTHQGLLAIKRGNIAAGSQLLRTSLNQIGGAGLLERLVAFLDTTTETLAHNGETSAALAALTATIEDLERTEERWLLPELLHIRGELLLSQDSPRETAAAENYFRQALDLARSQGALSWELRAATSLARLLSAECRPADALAILQPVYDRFTEGFGTADLKAAKALLYAPDSREKSEAAKGFDRPKSGRQPRKN
jgi:predicted ATPase/DNA-binding winged helix-turn-helix (wHTH) protein